MNKLSKKRRSGKESRRNNNYRSKKKKLRTKKKPWIILKRFISKIRKILQNDILFLIINLLLCIGYKY